MALLAKKQITLAKAQGAQRRVSRVVVVRASAQSEMVRRHAQWDMLAGGIRECWGAKRRAEVAAHKGGVSLCCSCCLLADARRAIAQVLPHLSAIQPIPWLEKLLNIFMHH